MTWEVPLAEYMTPACRIVVLFSLASMSEFEQPDGGVYTPFRIFIRAAGEYSDSDLLAIFDLQDYHPVTFPPRHGRVVLMDNCDGWIVVCDDWYYTLWNRKQTRNAIRRLVDRHDLFTTDVGDTDRSFSFSYYVDGKLRRELKVEDRGRGGRHTIVSDVGTPLPDEIAARKHQDEMLIVDAIATTYGLTLPQYGSVRCHSPRTANG